MMFRRTLITAMSVVAATFVASIPMDTGFAQTASSQSGSARSERPALPASIVTRAEARSIIDGAIAYAKAGNMLMAVVVVDQSGDVIAAERMDGAVYRLLQLATGKAFASAIFGQTTEELGAVYKTRPDRYFGIMNMYPGKVFLVGGGVPLALDGKLVGAVGVAGLPEGVDEKAGRAGIADWMKARTSGR